MGDVIFVHYFAQNYLCQHQNEVQGLHWRHKQVTLMPTVAHFKCSKCHQLATHGIVHISDDMRHDAHLVKVFTQKSIEVLKSNNVNICKMIEFTDQAPSQYKNKKFCLQSSCQYKNTSTEELLWCQTWKKLL